MNPELFIAFVIATVILVVMPGPNMLLIVSQSLRYGPRAGLLTVAGTGFAQAQQLMIVGLGLTSFMVFLAEWFEVLRWAGVAYLLFLGVQALRAPVDEDANAEPPAGSAQRRFWQAVFVSWTNPKVLGFYVAFFPQFMDPALPSGPQLWLLCPTFLMIAMTLDSAYALMAGRIGRRFAGRSAVKLRNRLTGGFLILAGIGLALVRRN